MPESIIDKKTLEHLAALARLELKPEEEEKLLKDLGAILGYFEELKSLDTSGAEPIYGFGAKNAFRDDEERESTNRGAGVESFPDKKDDYLKIPPVFQ